MFNTGTNIVTPVDVVVQELASLHVDTTMMDDNALRVYRLQLNKIKTLSGGLMAKTSTKKHDYNTKEVEAYIKQILSDGYALKATELSSNPAFVEAQKINRFSDLIKECVKSSPFGTSFNVPHLKGLCKHIASSNTLHELRQAVKLIIEPLRYFREQEDQSELIDQLTTEVDELSSIADERKRVIDEIVGAYEDADKDVQTLRLCESAKLLHGLSDEEAAKVGGISRKKLLSLRKNITLSNSCIEEETLCN